MLVTITLHNGQCYSYADVMAVDQVAGELVYIHGTSWTKTHEPTTIKHIIISA